jgi:hypothetical protein
MHFFYFKFFEVGEIFPLKWHFSVENGVFIFEMTYLSAFSPAEFSYPKISEIYFRHPQSISLRSAHFFTLNKFISF